MIAAPNILWDVLRIADTAPVTAEILVGIGGLWCVAPLVYV
jgi:hypothetical protein